MSNSQTAIEVIVGVGICGNAVIEGGEQCEGADLGGQSCVDLGFGGGELTCDISCSFDMTMCHAPATPARSLPKGSMDHWVSSSHTVLVPTVAPTSFLAAARPASSPASLGTAAAIPALAEPVLAESLNKAEAAMAETVETSGSVVPQSQGPVLYSGLLLLLVVVWLLWLSFRKR